MESLRRTPPNPARVVIFPAVTEHEASGPISIDSAVSGARRSLHAAGPIWLPATSSIAQSSFSSGLDLRLRWVLVLLSSSLRD
jgi:hypothetical protein